MTHMNEKNYIIERYKNRKDWLSKRGIGGSDLCSIVNKVGRWGNFIEVYDRLKGKEEKEANTISMSNGRRAEEPIKELFFIAHPNLIRKSPKGTILLVRRKDYPEITLSPDTLLQEGKEQGFAEIKLKQIFSESQIPEYMMNLKEQDPQYWWQCIDYFVAKTDCTFGYLVVAFEILEKDEKGKWVHSRYVIEELRIPRNLVLEDIDIAEKALVSFITENLRPGIRPRTKVQTKQEVKIEWTKLSPTRKLKP